MANNKQLIIVVEGTTVMAPYWSTIVSNYLDKIIRSFCRIDMTAEKSSSSAASDSTFELALVMFNAYAYSASLVQRSCWTRDVYQFLGWLSTLSFSGGESNYIATAEGLAEALMMYDVSQNGHQAQQNLDGNRHCILVSASNPYPWPTRVYRPAIEIMKQSEINEAQPENPLYNAETVSTWFGLCSISLSVISPKQLPELKALYNAAKPNHRISEPAVDIIRPDFLVLISDGFSEACAALSRPCLSQRNSSNFIGPSSWNFAQGTVEVGPGMPLQALGVQSVGLNNSALYIPKSRQANKTTLNGPLVSMENVAQATVKVKPTLGMPRQAQGMQSVGSNNSKSNMAIPKQGAQSKYVKFWEGSLFGQRQGGPLFITKLEGYKNDKASETLAANWPSTMYTDRFVTQDFMNKQCVSEGIFFVFRAMNQHIVLSRMQEKKLYAVIQLPSQTLLLSVTDKPFCLIAKLFPGDKLVFKPKIPTQVTQQHQEQQLPQQQQPALQQQNHPQLQQYQFQQLQQLQQRLHSLRQQKMQYQLRHQPSIQLEQQQQEQQSQQQHHPQLQQQQLHSLQQQMTQYQLRQPEQQQISQPQQIVADGMGHDHTAKNGGMGKSEPL